MSAATVAASLVREARERRGQSQRDFADSAGTTQSVIARIESGQANPTIETLFQLAAAANFDLKLELVPRRVHDTVIEAYKPGIDQTLLVENLRRSVEDRLRLNDEIVDATRSLGRALRVAEPAP
jgi:transcriptional regulator with XRE-family HTH domain